MRIWLLWFAMFCATAGQAQTPAQSATDAIAQLQDASRSLQAAQVASDRVAALTQTVRAYEDGLAALREGLRRAAIREQSVAATLNAQSGRVSRLLSVLQTMESAPAPLLLLHPSGPTGTARSGMMVSEVTAALTTDVAELRQKLEEVAILRQLQESSVKTLRDGLEGAQTARSALSTAIAQRNDLPRRFTEDPVQTALLIASTETLEGFASGLSGTFLTGEAPVDARPDKGNLPLPVLGTVVRGYQVEDAAGISRPGVIVATRDRAMVTAPAAATLLFHGELLDYGTIVILEPAADVLIVIAGLERVFGQAGDVLPKGTPIGLMGGENAPSDIELNEEFTNAANTATQTLYLEVREGQVSVDPTEWFALLN